MQPETSQQTVQVTATSGSADPAALPQRKVALGVLGAGNFASAVLLPASKSFPEIEDGGHCLGDRV